MIRVLAVFVIAATFMPASAEARKLRFGFGGGNARVTEVPAQSAARPGFGTGVATGAVLSPRRARSQEQGRPVQDADPARVPFPPSTAPAPAFASLGAADPKAKAWCHSEIVVGGFCVVN